MGKRQAVSWLPGLCAHTCLPEGCEEELETFRVTATPGGSCLTLHATLRGIFLCMRPLPAAPCEDPARWRLLDRCQWGTAPPPASQSLGSNGLSAKGQVRGVLGSPKTTDLFPPFRTACQAPASSAFGPAAGWFRWLL